MPNILIIDDDAHINDIVSKALQSEGYSVSSAYSGTEALLLLSQSKPDLILLDLMLPGLSGEELLPQIKDIPVIVVSAKADVTDKVELLIGGAVDYITKPFHMEEFLQGSWCSCGRTRDMLKDHFLLIARSHLIRISIPSLQMARNKS